jgi:hypothetical protein
MRDGIAMEPNLKGRSIAAQTPFLRTVATVIGSRLFSTRDRTS